MMRLRVFWLGTGSDSILYLPSGAALTWARGRWGRFGWRERSGRRE